MKPFADHFSGASASYAEFRPAYPDALFAWLAEQAPARARAWDCATGTGQAATGLARYFDVVIATDASAAQVTNATRIARIAYAVMRAEEAALASRSVTLVCVAQALHWFQRPAFYREAARVLEPDGLLAVWKYGLATVDPAIDRVIGHFYHRIVGPYWPPERALVEAGYRTIEFPFRELEVPKFEMEAWWTLAQLTGYLRTWSAVARFQASLGADPVAPLIPQLERVWVNPEVPRRVRWPLEIRTGRAPA